MAHALVTMVDLTGRPAEDTEQMLKERIIPMVKELPGFQSAVWARSADGKGLGIAVFDSEENAASARDNLETVRPADAPPILSAEVYTVTGQA